MKLCSLLVQSSQIFHSADLTGIIFFDVYLSIDLSIYLSVMCMSVFPACQCITVLGGQGRVTDPLEQELQRVVSHHVGGEKLNWVFCKNNHC